MSLAMQQVDDVNVESLFSPRVLGTPRNRQYRIRIQAEESNFESVISPKTVTTETTSIFFSPAPGMVSGEHIFVDEEDGESMGGESEALSEAELSKVSLFVVPRRKSEETAKLVLEKCERQPSPKEWEIHNQQRGREIAKKVQEIANRKRFHGNETPIISNRSRIDTFENGDKDKTRRRVADLFRCSHSAVHDVRTPDDETDSCTAKSQLCYPFGIGKKLCNVLLHRTHNHVSEPQSTSTESVGSGGIDTIPSSEEDEDVSITVHLDSKGSDRTPRRSGRYQIRRQPHRPSQVVDSILRQFSEMSTPKQDRNTRGRRRTYTVLSEKSLSPVDDAPLMSFEQKKSMEEFSQESVLTDSTTGETRPLIQLDCNKDQLRQRKRMIEARFKSSTLGNLGTKHVRFATPEKESENASDNMMPVISASTVSGGGDRSHMTAEEMEDMEFLELIDNEVIHPLPETPQLIETVVHQLPQRQKTASETTSHDRNPVEAISKLLSKDLGESDGRYLSILRSLSAQEKKRGRADDSHPLPVEEDIAVAQYEKVLNHYTEISCRDNPLTL